MTSESAGVRIDPQLIYAIPLGLSLLFGRWYPIHIVPPQLAAPIGIALLICGVALAASAVRRFRFANTSLQPWEPSSSLITDGPFQFSRNPVYLAYTLVYLGIGVWVNSVWPVALLPLVIGLMHSLVIRREESYLESRFGDVYLSYKQRVRRWL